MSVRLALGVLRIKGDDKKLKIRMGGVSDHQERLGNNGQESPEPIRLLFWQTCDPFAMVRAFLGSVAFSVPGFVQFWLRGSRRNQGR